MTTIRPNYSVIILAAFCGPIAVSPALAMDPVCNQVKAVTQPLRTKPFHMYMTETETFSKPGMAKTASSLGMGGTKKSEEISTGKSIYVLTNGKWVDMQTSFADMEKDKDTDPKKALDSSKCRVLPDEAAFGQPASVYMESTPALGIETKMWISKTTHLPIRTDITNDQGAMKTVSMSRYEYVNVQAPANAMTMKDMIKSRH